MWRLVPADECRYRRVSSQFTGATHQSVTVLELIIRLVSRVQRPLVVSFYMS